MNLQWRKAVRDSRLDTTARAVAFTLDTYADRNGLCWPSLATISRGAGLSDTNRGPAVQALRRLEAAGFIRISRSRRAPRAAGARDSDRMSNTYLLTLPTVQLTHTSTVQQMHSDSAADAHSTVHLDDEKCAADAHEAGSRTGPREAGHEPGADDEPGPTHHDDEEPGPFTRRLQHVLRDIPR